MADVLASDVVQDLDGTVLSEARWLADGTVELYEAGALVESRRQTAEEAERFAPKPLSAEERLEALAGSLATARTLAEVRAAAAAVVGD